MAVIVDHCSISTLITEDSYVIDLIYTHWFGATMDAWLRKYPLNIKLWFKVQKKVDQEIKEKFGKYLIETAISNSSLHRRWQSTHRDKLVLIILFGQFSRKIYRNTTKMFEFDSFAVNLALEVIDDATHITSYSLARRSLSIFLLFIRRISFTRLGVLIY